MSALIAGLDFSSKRIDAALIPLDADDGSDAPPVTLRAWKMPTWRGETTPAFRSVERCRVVRAAMRELLRDVRYGEVTFSMKFGHERRSAEVVHVCIEEPFGPSRKADNVMRELYGAILACVPSHIERDTITTQEWRRITWPIADEVRATSIDWKTTAIARVCEDTGVEMDEHQAESFLIARACRARLDKAFERGVA